MNAEFVKIEVYLPAEAIEPVREALHKAGAGRIGNYDHCVSVGIVEGYWRPLENADPYLGTIGQISHARECKLEVRCPFSAVGEAVKAIRAVHPYEEPVINVIPLLDVGE